LSLRSLGLAETDIEAKGRFWLPFLRIEKLSFASGDHSREKPGIAVTCKVFARLALHRLTRRKSMNELSKGALRYGNDKTFEAARNGNVACRRLIRF
jgi:hypothetical protein